MPFQTPFRHNVDSKPLKNASGPVSGRASSRTEGLPSAENFPRPTARPPHGTAWHTLGAQNCREAIEGVVVQVTLRRWRRFPSSRSGIRARQWALLCAGAAVPSAPAGRPARARRTLAGSCRRTLTRSNGTITTASVRPALTPVRTDSLGEPGRGGGSGRNEAHGQASARFEAPPLAPALPAPAPGMHPRHTHASSCRRW